MSQKKNLEGKSISNYTQLLNEAHQQGLEEIFTRILIFPEPEKQVKALVWAKVRMPRGFFTALGEAESIESAEEKAKTKALVDALNKGKEREVKREKESGEKKQDLENKGKEKTEKTPVQEETKEGTRDFEPMTEAQRRYLFRLLAQQGINYEQAYTKLKQMFGVESLKDVSKGQASLMIEDILNGRVVVQAEQTASVGGE